MYTLHIRIILTFPFVAKDDVYVDYLASWFPPVSRHPRPAQQHFEPADANYFDLRSQRPNFCHRRVNQECVFSYPKKTWYQVVQNWFLRHAWHFPDWSFSYSNPQKDVEKSISHSKHRDQQQFSIFFFGVTIFSHSVHAKHAEILCSQRCDFFPPF